MLLRLDFLKDRTLRGILEYTSNTYDYFLNTETGDIVELKYRNPVGLGCRYSSNNLSFTVTRTTDDSFSGYHKYMYFTPKTDCTGLYGIVVTNAKNILISDCVNVNKSAYEKCSPLTKLILDASIGSYLLRYGVLVEHNFDIPGQDIFDGYKSDFMVNECLRYLYKKSLGIVDNEPKFLRYKGFCMFQCIDSGISVIFPRVTDVNFVEDAKLYERFVVFFDGEIAIFVDRDCLELSPKAQIASIVKEKLRGCDCELGKLELIEYSVGDYDTINATYKSLDLTNLFSIKTLILGSGSCVTFCAKDVDEVLLCGSTDLLRLATNDEGAASGTLIIQHDFIDEFIQHIRDCGVQPYILFFNTIKFDGMSDEQSNDLYLAIFDRYFSSNVIDRLYILTIRNFMYKLSAKLHKELKGRLTNLVNGYGTFLDAKFDASAFPVSDGIIIEDPFLFSLSHNHGINVQYRSLLTALMKCKILLTDSEFNFISKTIKDTNFYDKSGTYDIRLNEINEVLGTILNKLLLLFSEELSDIKFNVFTDEGNYGAAVRYIKCLDSDTVHLYNPRSLCLITGRLNDDITSR